MNRTRIQAIVLMLNAGVLLFGQSNTATSVSAASYRAVVAPDSIASAWGTGLAPNTVGANTNPVNGQPVVLPNSLGPVSLSLKGSGGSAIQPVLYMVSPGQINYVVPATLNLGVSTLTVNSGASTITGPVLASNVSPALFTADGSGAGVPAGTLLRVTSAGIATSDNLFQSGTGVFVPKAINLSASPSDKVYLILYGTGIRLHSLNPVQAVIGGIAVPVLYAGAQSQYPGFDQVNLGPLPQTLIGKGSTDLVITTDGVPSNKVMVAIQ